MSALHRAARRRRIAVVTGSRAEYGLLDSTMRAVAEHPRLNLQVVVAGMHLLRAFGRTVDEIVRDGWRVDARVRMQRGDGDPCDQALGLARGVGEIARYLERARTNVVVVLGDRIEAMAGALAGVTTGRCVAHIHGGDVATGDFDDTLRHSITKLSHVHFTATPAARRRVIRLGEEASRVYCVGAPGLDRLRELTAERPTQKPRSGLALIVHHPCGRSAETERRTMNNLLDAVASAGLSRFIIYPNSDRGFQGVIQAIERHHQTSDRTAVHVARSLRRDVYLRRLIEADVLAGNSSSGLLEAAAAGTPSVNVGPRQQGRERDGRWVVDAEEDRASIRAALDQALRVRPITNRRRMKWNKTAGGRIADVLAKIPLDEAFSRKTITY